MDRAAPRAGAAVPAGGGARGLLALGKDVPGAITNVPPAVLPGNKAVVAHQNIPGHELLSVPAAAASSFAAELLARLLFELSSFRSAAAAHGLRR